MININNKQWDKVTCNDIKKVLLGSDDESFFYEFKSDEEDPKKLVKEISALANTYGGYIFLGVNNDKSVGGCKKWTEQRIHTTIHDLLTPTPIFDVRKFKVDGKTVLVIRVDEGPIPPYITTGSGIIYERVSSGSFPIKDSSRLSLLYNKRIDQEARVKKKIEFDALENISILPNNLCAYIDMGFSVTCSARTNLQNNFYSIDLSSISNGILGNNAFSISRVGDAFMFTIGQLEQERKDGMELYPAGMHNYLIVYYDLSASCRILLNSNGKENLVDITTIFIMNQFYKEIYKQLCGDNFSKIFIHAQKYESLKVLKQFIPVYDMRIHNDFSFKNPFPNILQKHRDKYGENIVIQSNRVPFYGYHLIDRQFFDILRVKYGQEELIKELFSSKYYHLGYVDLMQFLKDDL